MHAPTASGTQFSWHPACAEQSLGARWSHAVTVPVQVEGPHEQPDCAKHVPASVSCWQGLSVPPQETTDVWQPLCEVQVVASSWAHGAIVPSQPEVPLGVHPTQLGQPRRFAHETQSVKLTVPVHTVVGPLQPLQAEQDPVAAAHAAHEPVEGVPWQALGPAVHPVHAQSGQVAQELTESVPEQVCGVG